MFTDEQICAINAEDENILVSAGAGSGKTTVLIERVLRKLSRVDIDKLLIVTYTDAAALQLRNRIANALSKRRFENENFERQLTLLTSAKICTLHSFCLSLIRDYFYLVDASPNFKVIDGNDMGVLESQVLDEILDDERYFKLIYRSNDNAEDLKKIVLEIYRMRKINPDFQNQHANVLEETVWWKSLVSELKIIFNEKIECYDYYDVVDSDSLFIHEITNALKKGFDCTRNILNANDFVRLPPRKNVEDETKNKFKNARDKLKATIKKLRSNIFFKSAKDVLDDVLRMNEYVDELFDLAEIFRKRLENIKSEKNVLSFDDMETMALEILKQRSQFFHEILIDEYQDINPIQETILQTLNCKSKFMVGDVKQSIYQFRNAAPELFVEKYNAYSMKQHGTKIDLSVNFRSSNTIIETINNLFKQLMTEEFTGIMFNELRAVNYDNESFAELHVLNCEDKIISEAQFICSKIKSLRPEHSYGDIAVLVRSTKNVKIISKVFKQNGIPISAMNNFFESEEVKMMINILQIIDNPLQDIPLASVLCSKIYGTSHEKLLEIRNIVPDLSFYDCVMQSDLKLRSDLTKWRTLKLSVNELINVILDDTNYFTFGDKESIIEFLDLAAGYEKNLFHFINYIKNKQASFKQYACNGDFVKLMTIHKSKGLEFPVVFVSMLGQNFNIDDIKKQVLIDYKLSIGAKLIKNNKRYITLPYAALKYHIKHKNLSEEMRVLYVAMTRAKRKLILTGSGKITEDCSLMRAKCFLDWLTPRMKYQLHTEIEMESQDTTNYCEFQMSEPNDDFVYPFDNLQAPTKTSITQLQANGKFNFLQPKFMTLQPNFSATERGTILHKVLQHIPLEINCVEEINVFLKKLIKRGILTDAEHETVPVDKILLFLQSNLAYRMRNADYIKKEAPFVLGLDSSLIHGIIDCFFIHENKIVLVDYKTGGRFSDLQMEIYARALELKYGKVDEILIYSFKNNNVIVYNRMHRELLSCHGLS